MTPRVVARSAIPSTMIHVVLNVMNYLRKWLGCSWRHRKDRCYTEVWGRGLDGPWHCARCHPCSEEIDILLKKGEKLSYRKGDIEYFKAVNHCIKQLQEKFITRLGGKQGW